MTEYTSHQVIDYLKSLDQRISSLEERLGFNSVSEPLPEPELNSKPIDDEMPDSFEFNIGEYWFAYIGIFILMVGCLLLMGHPIGAFHPVIPSVIGFTVAIGMYYFGNFSRESYKFLALHLWGASYILIFFATDQLFQYIGLKSVTAEYLRDAGLLLIGALVWINSNRHKSSYLNAVSLTLVAFTALVINRPSITLAIILGVAMLTVYAFKHSGRIAVFIYGSLLVYMVHLHWALGNPFLSSGAGVAVVPQAGLDLTFLLLYTIVLSSSLFWFKPVPTEETDAAAEEIMLYSNALANGLVGGICYTIMIFLHKVPDIMSFEIAMFAVYFILGVV
ncbi:MAG: hypothetical protein COY19_10500, partial [Candidatus Marinimicrobia bacterium CG_4_10_14_0_2_um_filter_48_9]